MLEVRD